MDEQSIGDTMCLSYKIFGDILKKRIRFAVHRNWWFWWYSNGIEQISKIDFLNNLPSWTITPSGTEDHLVKNFNELFHKYGEIRIENRLLSWAGTHL